MNASGTGEGDAGPAIGSAEWRQVEQDGLDAIASTGVDLSKPRPVEYYLSFARRADAESALQRASDMGYSVSMERSPARRWVLTVRDTALLTVDHLVEMSRTWVGLAASLHDGHYDGWGTVAGFLDPPGWRPKADR